MDGQADIVRAPSLQQLGERFGPNHHLNGDLLDHLAVLLAADSSGALSDRTEAEIGLKEADETTVSAVQLLENLVL
jgi:hypothetical protein